MFMHSLCIFIEVYTYNYFIYMCIYIYISVCMCVCVCVCIYINTRPSIACLAILFNWNWLLTVNISWCILLTEWRRSPTGAQWHWPFIFLATFVSGYCTIVLAGQQSPATSLEVSCNRSSQRQTFLMPLTERSHVFTPL